MFSVRQTGNQIGAVCGSLALPAIAIALGPAWCYAAVAASALIAIALFEWLRPTYAGKIAPPPQLDLRARLALVTADRRIAMLALASMPFSAMQVSLNTVFVTLGTRELGLSHIEAGMALACAQGGGLVGRLGWGLVAMRLNASRGVLVVIGLGMAFCAALLGLDGASLGRSWQFAVADTVRADGVGLEWCLHRRNRAPRAAGQDRRNHGRRIDGILCRPVGRAGAGVDPGRRGQPWRGLLRLGVPRALRHGGVDLGRP